jgi:hypothetical protein
MRVKVIMVVSLSEDLLTSQQDQIRWRHSGQSRPSRKIGALRWWADHSFVAARMSELPIAQSPTKCYKSQRVVDAGRGVHVASRSTHFLCDRGYIQKL